MTDPDTLLYLETCTEKPVLTSMKTDIVHREEAPKIWTFNDDLAELVEGLKIGWGEGDKY